MAGQIDFKVAAVLPAGGVGQRMGLEMPKQVSYRPTYFVLSPNMALGPLLGLLTLSTIIAKFEVTCQDFVINIVSLIFPIKQKNFTDIE